jgi:hypothetical protein
VRTSRTLSTGSIVLRKRSAHKSSNLARVIVSELGLGVGGRGSRGEPIIIPGRVDRLRAAGGGN